MYEHDVCVDSNNLFQSLYETTLRVKGMYVRVRRIHVDFQRFMKLERATAHSGHGLRLYFTALELISNCRVRVATPDR